MNQDNLFTMVVIDTLFCFMSVTENCNNYCDLDIYSTVIKTGIMCVCPSQKNCYDNLVIYFTVKKNIIGNLTDGSK